MLDLVDRLADDEEAQLADILTEPVAFAECVLGHDVWDVPAAILRALDKPHARVAVKSCHASGKTFTAAEAAIWFTTRYDDGLVISTAPTWVQVRDLLWGEIRSMVGEAAIAYPKPSQTRWTLGEKNYAMGLSTNEGVRFQGFHGRILVPVDEAAGIRPAILEAMKGMRAGGDVRQLLLGNPTIPSGEFFDVFHKHRSGWDLFTISAFDTPNLRGLYLAGTHDGQPFGWGDLGGRDLLTLTDDELDDNPRPYLVTRRWVREMWDECEHSPDHPFWASRVLGTFPRESEDQLISLAWIEAAQRRWLDSADDGGIVVAGLDVAGGGDAETVLVVRSPQWRVHRVTPWRVKDARGPVVAACLAWGERLRGVAVDKIGIGHHVAAHLRDNKIRAFGVNVGDPPLNPARFKNRKAELYWGLREIFQGAEIALPPDDRLVTQLCSIRWGEDARGRIYIESKEDAYKRGVRGLDRAEGVMLSVAAHDGARTRTRASGVRRTTAPRVRTHAALLGGY